MTVRQYLGALRRRAWIVLTVLVFSAAVAVVLASRQEALYSASAEIWLSRQNLGALLTGTDDPNSGVPSERLILTQARLARLPVVASNTLAVVDGESLTPAEFLATSSVTPDPEADLLRFEVTSSDPELAARLATTYARQFTLYRRRLDTMSLERAQARLDARLAELRAEAGRRSAAYESLLDRQQELDTLLALQTGNAILVRSAGDAEKVQPRPVRAGLLGLGLGLVAGIALAFLAEALDTRVRSVAEISAGLGLPLLARIPRPSRRYRRRKRLVMLRAPASAAAEPYRALRTSIELEASRGALLDAESSCRMIMVTSALAGDGKTTTVANLAVAFARTGRHVVLVDLDLQKPAVASVFGLDRGLGVLDVASGGITLAGALVSLGSELGHGANGNRPGSAADGTLEILPAGAPFPGAGDVLASEPFKKLFELLRERAEIVLIDSPPLLGAADALALSALVDAIVVVTRHPRLRRPLLRELRRELDRCLAPAIGFVLTDPEAEVEDGNPYAGQPRTNPAAERRPARV